MLMRYVVRRLLMLIPIVFGVTLLVFFSIHLVPGDPARVFLGHAATPESVRALDRQWGLNHSMPVQYWLYLVRLAHFNLGQSLFYQSSVSSLIAGHVVVTLLLLCYGAIGAIVISVPLAALAAIKPGGIADQVVRIGGTVGLGMPSFWVGTTFILLFGVVLKIFPVGGYGSSWPSHLWSLVLPGLTIAVSIAPMLLRSLRTGLIEALGSDFVAFARAKGTPSRTVLFRYGLRNAGVAGVSVLGINIGFLVGGTVVVENVFGLPGLGQLMIQSILSSDFSVVQGITLVFAIVVVLVYLFTDIAYALLDPRVQLS
jgi:peptide/nickel transport system permease protein